MTDEGDEASGQQPPAVQDSFPDDDPTAVPADPPSPDRQLEGKALLGQGAARAENSQKPHRRVGSLPRTDARLNYCGLLSGLLFRVFSSPAQLSSEATFYVLSNKSVHHAQVIR